MTIHEVRARSERRLPDTATRISALVDALTLTRGAPNEGARCAVCGQTTGVEEVSVLPVTYVAACLVRAGLEVAHPLVPLRRAPLCDLHRDHFGALFVDVADPRWNVGRLEDRAEVLGGVLEEGLLVFGGAKALQVVAEFHTAVAALAASVNHADP